MKTLKLFFVVSLLSLVALASCSKDDMSLVESISLSSSSIELTLGETFPLTASVSPSEAGNVEIVWSSDASYIATVREGIVTAVGEGSTIIKAATRDGRKFATCKVSVKKQMGDSKDGIPFDFSEGVELIGIVFRLAGAQEYNTCQIGEINSSADRYFANMKHHQAVYLAKEFRKTGVGYDAVTSYGVHLSISLTGVVYFNTMYNGSTDSSFERWTSDQRYQMLTALNDFYRESGFKKWYQSTETIRAKAIENFKQTASVDLSWLKRFYGNNVRLSEQIVLSFMVGLHNNGISITMKDGSVLLSPVMGSAFDDGEGGIFYSNSILPTLVHEFSHPFCNPTIDKYWASMQSKSSAVFRMVEGKMRALAYGSPEIMMHETLVRACTICYLAVVENDENAQARVQKEVNDGFLLVPPMVRVLLDRANDIVPGSTIDSVMPKLIEEVNKYDVSQACPVLF